MKRINVDQSFADFLSVHEWGILAAVVIAGVMSWAIAEANSRG